jgi:SpoVK/Ycf46/Vps4 family AAA+-type ATPase
MRDRRKIIRRLLADVEHSITSAQLDELALATEGWSGSDLESMTREAVMAPVRECLRAAAVLKKRESKASHQWSGADLSQTQDAKRSEDANSATRESLLNSFRNLRPVSSEDFEVCQ